MKTRYWLRILNLPWQEATKEQFIQAKRSAGFRPKDGCGRMATAGFDNGTLRGRVTHGEITELRRRSDPEFALAVYAADRKK